MKLQLRHSINKSRQYGFTMVELMVTLSVLGILIALAAPSFQSLIERVRIESQVNKLKTDMSYARTEAMRTGFPINVCRRKSGTQICATDTITGWENGWIVYNDLDGDNKINNNEVPLRISDDFSQFASAQNNNGNYLKQRISFSPQGTPVGGLNTGCIKFCSAATGCTNPNSRYLILNRIGRLRVITEDENMADPNICQ